MKTPSKLLDNKMLLAMIGKRIPAVFDVIPQHGLVRGKPDPVPWIAVGADLARLALQSAIAAKRAGGNMHVAMDILEEWCPTGKTPNLPWGLLKDYFHGEPPPRPEEINIQDLNLGLALGLAAASAKLHDMSVIDVANQGIERSLSALGQA
jgi:hypothetical protein